MRTIKKKGSFSEASSFKKRGHLVRLSILVQNGGLSLSKKNIGYISRGGFISENGSHSVRAFISKRGGHSVRAFYFLEWGHQVREHFENGVQ